jgi:3-mercaptopyruvate sulfurtransferase SseA
LLVDAYRSFSCRKSHELDWEVDTFQFNKYSYTQLLKDGKFYLRSVKEILSVPEKPLMFTCGSGVTACINMIAYELVSDNSKAIYDGSWTEWGQRKITNWEIKWNYE